MMPLAAVLHRIALACVALSLEEAIDAAEHLSPQMLVAQVQVAQVATEVPVAGVLPNPQLSLATVRHSFQFSSSISVPMLLFGQRRLAQERAQGHLQAARQSAQWSRLQARWLATSQWLELWLNQQNFTIRSQTQQRYGLLLRMAQQRFEDGAAAQVEVIRARAAAARADAERLYSLAQVSAASARLQGLLSPNKPVDPNVRATGALPGSVMVPSLGLVWQQLETHPAVAAQRQLAEADRAAYELERRRRLPIVSLNVGYSAGSAVPPNDELQLGLSAEVPLFHLRGAFIAQQHNTWLLSQKRTAMALASQRTELAAALQGLEAAQSRAQSLLDQALPAASEAAHLAADGFAEGAFDMTSVLAVEQVLADTRLETVSAQAEQLRARATVEFCMGTNL